MASFKVWVLLGLLLTSKLAGAWGHSTDLNESWAKSQLVFAVLQKKQIKFCLDIQSGRFDEASVRAQTESALKLWLSALEPLKLGAIAVREVDCMDASFHLKIQIGEDSAFPTLGSYQIPEWQGEHYYSLVKIDSNYSHIVDGKSYRNEDFLKFTGGEKLKNQLALMQNISFVKRKSLQEFCAQEGLDCQAVFLSTYLTLIHEIGHSFGLCDTAGEMTSCDPKFMSGKSQPASVMKDDTFFYLQKDDVEGIRSLFRRFLKTN